MTHWMTSVARFCNEKGEPQKPNSFVYTSNKRSKFICGSVQFNKSKCYLWNVHKHCNRHRCINTNSITITTNASI